MRIGIVVNDVDTESPKAATTVIAHAAARRGHDVLMIGVGDLTYHSGSPAGAVARRAPMGGDGSQAEFLAAVQGADAERQTISTAELDVLFLRYNPVEALDERPWEYEAGIMFGQVCVLQGTIVLSHPYTLAYAVNKMYLEHFPEDIRPRTVITRRYDEIARFHERQEGRIVVKPLRGYGGRDVYRIDPDAANLRQIVESLAREGYIVAQEYLPEATEGDTRLFLFNARPLQVDGHYAALRRVNENGDFRSNLTAGGRPRQAEISDRMLEIAEIVRPRLLADGIFDVGLDIVGDKLVEINAMSAGGLNAASELEGVDFGAAVVELIERKVRYRQRYGAQLRNRALAVMD